MKRSNSRNSNRSGSRSGQRKDENLTVAVRVRPHIDREKNLDSVVKIGQEGKIRVASSGPGGDKTFECTYDRVFGPESSQSEVFDFVQPCIRRVMSGVNATVFAYGQTGTGKTHTILGSDNQDTSAASQSTGLGIIPRATSDIFHCIDTQRRQHAASVRYQPTRDGRPVWEALVTCSYMQIYNEKLYDLLADRKRSKRLTVRERHEEGVVIEGLSSVVVNDTADVLSLLKNGNLNRAVRGTEYNTASSRSHAILQITVSISIRPPHNMEDHDVRKTTAKLNMVDLAGSEKWNTSIDMKRCHEKELRNINASLSALGNCIAALTEVGRKHVPYRDSTLTRLLKDSLGGNTCTTLIATITSASNSSEETLRTLAFADRAKSVMQRVQENVSVNGSTKLAKARAEIAALQQKLLELRTASEEIVAQKNQVNLVNIVQKFERDISSKDEKIESLAAKNAKYLAILEDNGARIEKLESMLQRVAPPPSSATSSYREDRPPDEHSFDKSFETFHQSSRGTPSSSPVEYSSGSAPVEKETREEEYESDDWEEEDSTTSDSDNDDTHSTARQDDYLSQRTSLQAPEVDDVVITANISSSRRTVESPDQYKSDSRRSSNQNIQQNQEVVENRRQKYSLAHAVESVKETSRSVASDKAARSREFDFLKDTSRSYVSDSPFIKSSRTDFITPRVAKKIEPSPRLLNPSYSFTSNNLLGNKSTGLRNDENSTKQACERHKLSGCVLCALKKNESNNNSSPDEIGVSTPVSSNKSMSLYPRLPSTSSLPKSSSLCSAHQLAACILCETNTSTGSGKLFKAALGSPFAKNYQKPDFAAALNSPVGLKSDFYQKHRELKPAKASSSRCDRHNLANCILCGNSTVKLGGGYTTSSYSLDSRVEGASSQYKMQSQYRY